MLTLALAAYAAATVWLAAVALQTLALAVARAARPARLLPADDGANARAPWPAVVVQIPVYDEPPALVARALDAALVLDARGPLEVQLLDDSRDPSAGRALCAARHTDARPVTHLARPTRDGFKAGALAAGLAATDAPLAAVFDVDFRPRPDTLHALVSPLLADPSLAFVQAPWAHEARTPLARAQAALLALHFSAEQGGRDRLGLPVTFNGTAGVWRRDAIAAAGGWEGDTLAEDLDLALRARLVGRRGRVLDAPGVPADLPPTLAAWRVQQARWAGGLAGVGRKLLPQIWRSRLPLRDKVSATGQVAVAGSLPALLVLVLAHAPAVLVGLPPAVGALGLVALVAATGAHGIAQALREPATAADRASSVLAGMAFPLALVVPATRSVARALAGRPAPFARTPKDGRPRADALWAWDAALAAVCAAGAVALVVSGLLVSAAVQTGFAFAFAATAAVGRGRPVPTSPTRVGVAASGSR